MSSIIEKAIKRIMRKKPKELKTDEFAVIKITESAKEKGIEEEENKEICFMKHGKIIKKIPYVKGYERVIKEIHGMPIINETISYEQEFKFPESATFGQTTRRRYL